MASVVGPDSLKPYPKWTRILLGIRLRIGIGIQGFDDQKLKKKFS